MCVYIQNSFFLFDYFLNCFHTFTRSHVKLTGP